MTNEELIAHMKDFAQRCSSISKLHRIGASVSERASRLPPRLRGNPFAVLPRASPRARQLLARHHTSAGSGRIMGGVATGMRARFWPRRVLERPCAGRQQRRRPPLPPPPGAPPAARLPPAPNTTHPQRAASLLSCRVR